MLLYRVLLQTDCPYTIFEEFWQCNYIDAEFKTAMPNFWIKK